MVTRQDILDALDKREPFRVFARDGRMFVVKGLDEVGVAQTHMKFGSGTRPRDEAYNGLEEVAYDEIVRLEPLILPAPAAPITPEDLDAAMQKRPFVPFRIFSTDGKSYKVKGFGQIAIGKLYAWLTDEFDRRGDRIYYEKMARMEPIGTAKP